MISKAFGPAMVGFILVQGMASLIQLELYKAALILFGLILSLFGYAIFLLIQEHREKKSE